MPRPLPTSSLRLIPPGDRLVVLRLSSTRVLATRPNQQRICRFERSLKRRTLVVSPSRSQTAAFAERRSCQPISTRSVASGRDERS